MKVYSTGLRQLASVLDLRSWHRKRISRFTKKHGYKPCLETPRLFSEKLLKRCLYDDDPHYSLYAVKLFAPYFVKQKSVQGLQFPERLKVVPQLRPRDFEDLPESFVIKSSFGSGLNQLVIRKSELDVDAVCRRFNKRRQKVTNAQGKTDLSNCFIFEAFLGDPTLGPPNDYKFHCFNGLDGRFTCYVQVDSDRDGDHRQTMFDQQFNPIEMRFGGQAAHDVPPARPQKFDDLIRISREISSGFDYVRVDLYLCDDNIFFGEITPFHQGAMAPLIPDEWDEFLGKLWDQRFPAYDASAF